MRIVFIGAERVGLACLKKLIDLHREPVGVFTADDSLKPQIADFVPFDPVVLSFGIPLFKIQDSKGHDFIRQVQELKPDLILIISWSQIIPQEVVRTPALGCVGIHYSLLPTRRGGAPLFWAIWDGLKESGISLFYLNGGVDTGDLIAQKKFSITPEDTAKTLLDKIEHLAPELLTEQIDAIVQGKAPRVAQDERMRSVTKRRTPEEGEIPSKISLEELDRFIRALAPPYPGAFTWAGDHKLVFSSSRWKEGKLWVEGYLQ